MKTLYMQHSISKTLREETEECVLALGFFDGVHIGHRKLIRTAKEIANQKKITFAVMTFYPHPKEVVSPSDGPMKYLTPLKVKEERFKNMGVEKLIVVKFDPVFARLSNQEFVETYIIGFCCKHVVAGFDYHYGYKGRGNMQLLKEQGQNKFEVTTIPKIEHRHHKISSTAIRKLLSHGATHDIPNYLGDYYEIRGIVQKSSLFYETYRFIEVFVEQDYMLPVSGVYHIAVEIDQILYRGVCQQIKEQHLLLQLSNCPMDVLNKQVKVKWTQSIFGNANVYDINRYVLLDHLAI
ncbi:adenylyltransferase/cytidyltransferase family protein [Bacillus cytotoxicus]|uniref:adenylyltransferase/cytidyltransferase family protein n=1 Tax=Bacillus cytotoxicus TaxID=580165 RepID=UPI003D7C5BBD